MLTVALALLLAAPPASTGSPAVGGAPREGARLVATPGTWVGGGRISYAYRWYRCNRRGARCTTIRGATANAYRVQHRDIGSTLALTVLATDAGGTAVAYAPLVGVVAPAAAVSVPAAQPRLEGTPVVGQPLHVQSGTVPRPVSYAWLRCDAHGRVCALVPHATAPSYTPVADDAGHALVAQIRRGDVRVLSTTLGPTRAAPGPALQSPPAVTGAPQVGRRLDATAGLWSGAGAIRFAYQWYRCDGNGAHCASIRGATSPSYTQVARDAGATLGLTVHATDASGVTDSYSSLVGPVAVATKVMFSTGAPTLTGTPAAGGTLRAGTGEWHYPPRSFAYQWLRCNANGRVCVAVDGATAATYSPTAADRGHALVARVTAALGAATQAALTAAVSVE